MMITNTQDNKSMAIKLIVIALLSIALSAPAFAGGSHGGHGSGTTSSHKKPSKRVFSEEYMPHSEGHEHDAGLSPVGRPAAQQEATMTIEVGTFDTMRYAFLPALEIKPGDVVKFVITNQGKIPHEFSIGDDTEQEEHRAMMRKTPDMVHQDASTVTIQPGETEILTWKFNTADVVIACNIPGHYEAGMSKKIQLN
ncbi:MAG: copper-binding protein [Piscirickettsiaceae bacterium]|nr:MAG: copper-binding protein [Piscirickettsiaceae bacterium]